MLTEVQVEDLIKDLESKKADAEAKHKYVLVGMCDTTIHYLNLVLEK